MPPSPERGRWPADLAEARDPYLEDGVEDWGADTHHFPRDDPYGHVGHATDGNGASPYVDPWAADARAMDDGPAPNGERAPRALRDGPLERAYDDYFDDDDDLEEVEAASEATRNALEWAVVLVGAVLVALILRASLFQAFWIPSESMETTLLTNDRVLVNKISYRLHEIHRGDIVVFERPDDDPGEIRDLIKRVIALPGETVEATGGSIYINGQRLDEPYLDPGVITDDFPPTVVPAGEIFVMGDNRANSQDSRYFGTVPEERVVGRAFVLFWPVGRVGSL